MELFHIIIEYSVSFVFFLKRFTLEIISSWYDPKFILGFPGGSVVKNLPANAGDMGSTHWSEDP